MAQLKSAKRLRDDGQSQPSKKRRTKPAGIRGFVDKNGEDFQPVNLAESDDDMDKEADQQSDGEGRSDSQSHPESQSPKKKIKKASQTVEDEHSDDSQEPDGSSDDDEDDDSSDSDSASSSSEVANQPRQKTKSKRNDPSAFATSLSKILSTKLAKSRRADPVLSRSAEAHQSAKAAVDSALETKARKQLRLQKKEALERGRVKDVLVASRNPVTGEVDGSTTAEIMETERRLRKVAQRGVVKLFNAVRAAQVRAAEAERINDKEGVVGAARKGEKVSELSKKGFLDLIAAGGGSLRKGPMEEA